jgi:malate dehydrogenase
MPLIARGQMLGSDQPVAIHMLDIPSCSEALRSLKMELIDSALPLLRGNYFVLLLHKSDDLY